MLHIPALLTTAVIFAAAAALPSHAQALAASTPSTSTGPLPGTSMPLGHTVAVPGAKLFIYDTGGRGVPVVLLHENTGTSVNWENQFGPLVRAGYRVIAFDRRGWGGSVPDASSGPQPGSIAGDLEALAETLKLSKFDLVGVAGGGFAALEYLAWHPERVRGAVIAASTGAITDPEVADFFKRIDVPSLESGPPSVLEVGASYRGGNPQGTERWEAIQAAAQQKGVAAQPLRTPNTYAKLATITTPVLVINADADLLAPPGLMRLWAAHLKHHEWAVIDDAGHSVAWEQPAEFNRLVLAFLRRH